MHDGTKNTKNQKKHGKYKINVGWYNWKKLLEGQKKKRPNGNSTPFCKSIDSTTPQTRGLAPQSPQLCPKNAKRDPSRPPATTTATTIPPKKHKKTNNRGAKKTKTKLATHPSLWPVVWCFSTTRTTSRSYHGCLCCGFDPVFGDKS